MSNVIFLNAHQKPTRPVPLWREVVGEQLRVERQAQEKRLTDVAERSGVSQQYLSEVERGVKEPSSEILHAISGALDLEIPDLARQAADRMERNLTNGNALL
ncbi:MAG: helix-turn-helix domain-containing protein, partial [Yaniella sp.]|nr:helix-turn-helix domain-containing protein [Yaniella sp.]